MVDVIPEAHFEKIFDARCRLDLGKLECHLPSSVRVDVNLQTFRFHDDGVIRSDGPAKLELGKIEEIVTVLDADAFSSITTSIRKPPYGRDGGIAQRHYYNVRQAGGLPARALCCDNC